MKPSPQTLRTAARRGLALLLCWSQIVPALAAPTAAGTAATVAVGVALWAGFAFWAHAAWLGIAPLGR